MKPIYKNLRLGDRANFDKSNRTAGTIEDVGGLDRTTNFTQTLDDLPATMTAVNPATGDQTTTWLYGTTLADSGVARNDLLVSTIYPDSTGGPNMALAYPSPFTLYSSPFI